MIILFAFFKQKHPCCKELEFSEVVVSLKSCCLETVPEGKPEVNAASCCQIILGDSEEVGVDFKF